LSLSITTILFFLLTKCFIIVTLFLFPFPSIILLAFPSNSRSLSNHFHISLNDYHQYINTHTHIYLSIFTYIRSSVKRLLSHQITCRIHVDIKPTGLSKLMNILFEMILHIYREREDLNNLHNTNVKIYYDFKNKSWYFYLYEEEEKKMRAIKYLKRKWQK